MVATQHCRQAAAGATDVSSAVIGCQQATVIDECRSPIGRHCSSGRHQCCRRHGLVHGSALLLLSID